jgi:hypothetical protein
VNEGQREVRLRTHRAFTVQFYAGRFDFSTDAAYRMGMGLTLILAVIVPLLAVPGGAWLLQWMVPGAQTALGNPDILWAQAAVAAAPLVALAIFALVARREDDGALRASAMLAGALTLAVWAWYHMGAPGIEGDGVGLAMLVSPLAIGALTFIGYCLFARKAR